MIWRNHLDGVSNVLINNVNILSEKATNDRLDFPSVALGIRTLRTPSECFFHITITCFIMQICWDLF